MFQTFPVMPWRCQSSGFPHEDQSAWIAGSSPAMTCRGCGGSQTSHTLLVMPWLDHGIHAVWFLPEGLHCLESRAAWTASSSPAMTDGIASILSFVTPGERSGTRGRGAPVHREEAGRSGKKTTHDETRVTVQVPTLLPSSLTRIRARRQSPCRRWEERPAAQFQRHLSAV